MAAVHATPTVTQEQVACYCCGTSIDAGNLVRFDRHPHHGVCVGCAAWLHKRSLPIVHKVHPPFWWRLTPSRFHGQ
jgi:hypothetical protein